MQKQGDSLIFSHSANGQQIDVYGCWDKETPDGEYDFYDIYLRSSGVCLNEGDPFYSLPTHADISDAVARHINN